MTAKERRFSRRRTYYLVGMLLMTGLLVIALTSFLHMGHKKIDESVYTSPVKTLRALGRAEWRHKEVDGDKDGVKDYATSLDELFEAGFITRRLAEGEVGDPAYRYAVLSAGENGYELTASPAEVTSGSLFFYMDQTKVVRARANEPATRESSVYDHPIRGYEWGGK